LNGPNNLLPLGDTLYAVSKNNNLLVSYDLSEIADDPNAGAPDSEVLFAKTVFDPDHGLLELSGHSALAYHEGWLYVGTRTSGHIVRLPLGEDFRPTGDPTQVELVAQLDPFDASTRETADVTDMVFDEEGRLYVVSAQPSRVYRFTPDGDQVFDGRRGVAEPFVDMAAVTENPRMKSENILVHDGWLYITSGDGYGYQAGAEGTVYRVRVND
jgi:outer membrane protein assembly factor BamB